MITKKKIGIKMSNNNNVLILIPKCERYIEYALNIVNKLPRVEKFNIGNEFKSIMYSMLNNIIFLTKIKGSKVYYCNMIDSYILLQRIYIRIMYKNRWLDNKKYSVSIDMLDEIGRLLGGYIKSCSSSNNIIKL